MAELKPQARRTRGHGRGFGEGQGEARRVGRLGAGASARVAAHPMRPDSRPFRARSGLPIMHSFPAVWRVRRPAVASGRRPDCSSRAAFKSMIPNDFIQTLLSRVDIVEVIDRYVPLKKAGRELRRLLPVPQREDALVHGEPDQAVLPLLRLRRARHGHRLPDGARAASRFPDAVEELARDAGLDVPRVERAGEKERREEAADLTEQLLTAAKFYRAQLKDAPRAIDYLKGRGLTGAIAARFGIGYAPDAWQPLAAALSPTTTIRRSKRRASSFAATAASATTASAIASCSRSTTAAAGSIGFGGRVLGDGEPKYLNSPETPVFSKGRELYGLFLARQAIRDAGASSSSRATWTSSRSRSTASSYAVATLGTSTTAVHVQKLFRLTDTRRVLLRRRRRGPQGRVARAGKRAAGARRRQERAVPVPARRRGSRRLRAQARQGGVRAGAVERRCRCPNSCCAELAAQHPPTSRRGSRRAGRRRAPLPRADRRAGAGRAAARAGSPNCPACRKSELRALLGHRGRGAPVQRRRRDRAARRPSARGPARRRHRRWPVN